MLGVAAELDAAIASRCPDPRGCKRKGPKSDTKQYIGESVYWGKLPAATSNDFCKRVRKDHAATFHPELESLAGMQALMQQHDLRSLTTSGRSMQTSWSTRALVLWNFVGQSACLIRPSVAIDRRSCCFHQCPSPVRNKCAGILISLDTQQDFGRQNIHKLHRRINPVNIFCGHFVNH
jgi:hypothetical protein